MNNIENLKEKNYSKSEYIIAFLFFTLLLINWIYESYDLTQSLINAKKYYSSLKILLLNLTQTIESNSFTILLFLIYLKLFGIDRSIKNKN